MSGKKLLFLSLVVLFVLSSLSYSSESKKEDLYAKANIQPIKGNTKVPNLSLADLKGKKWETKDLKGKVIFLNFWATWCGPCKEEMPSMEELYQQFKSKDFIFLTISVDYEKKEIVKEFIRKHRYTFPVLLDPECGTLDLFQVKGIPTTFLIDKKGMMIGKATGPRNWKKPEVVSILNSLLEN
jgi:thiol-disulfide isomerase/thioredoxin